MLGIRRLLIADDFGPVSREGLRFALDLAARIGSDATLCHVHRPRTPRRRTRAAKPPEGGVIEQLLSALPLATDRGLRLDLHAFEGEAARGISRVAEECAADLIVMGVRPRRRRGGRVLGPVAAATLDRAPCPVLLVPEGASEVAFRLDRILVATDSGTPGGRALFTVADLARAAGDPDVVVVDLRNLEKPEDGAGGLPMDPLEVLERRVEGLRSQHLRASGRLLVGPPVPALLDLIGSEGFDLLALATRGRGARPLGALEREIVAAAPCPILLSGG